MILESTKLMSLARAEERASPQGQEGVLVLSPALAPIITLRGPLGTVQSAAVSATSIFDDSFVNGVEDGRAASQAAADSRLARLNRGLWRFHIVLQSIFDFTQTLNAQSQVRFALVDPESNTWTILHHHAVANVEARTEVDLELLLTPGTIAWEFLVRHAATGVGQTGRVSCSLYGSRLL